MVSVDVGNFNIVTCSSIAWYPSFPPRFWWGISFSSSPSKRSETHLVFVMKVAQDFTPAISKSTLVSPLQSVGWGIPSRDAFSIELTASPKADEVLPDSRRCEGSVPIQTPAVVNDDGHKYQ